MSEGFITIHRQIMKSAVYSDSHAVHLWLHILMKANHADNEFIMNTQIISVKRGEFITGRKKLSAETGIQESKIERLLKLFVKLGMIEQQKNSRNRRVIVLSYDSFQSGEQQKNNRRTTGEQLVNTNNNENNENKKESSTKADPIPYQQIKKIWNECTPLLPKCDTLSDKRKTAIKKLWNTKNDEGEFTHRNSEFYVNWFTFCNDDPWYNGTDSNSGKWKANIDFCLKVDNIIKKREELV